MLHFYIQLSFYIQFETELLSACVGVPRARLATLECGALQVKVMLQFYLLILITADLWQEKHFTSELQVTLESLAENAVF